MPEQPPQATTAARPKTRPDDARGSKPGTATMTQPHGGRIGQAPYVPTDEQRRKVREYAKVFPPRAEHMIARLMGISRSTLSRHHGDDMELGRAEMLAAVGAQMVNRAMNAAADSAKGDLDAQKFILARLGGWSTKVEMTGKDGGPVETVDLSGLSDAQLEVYRQLASAVSGQEPDDVTGEP